MASKELFSLGKLYPSDFLKPNEQPRCEPVELKLVMDEDGLVHLESTAPKEAMWGKYWYKSSITSTMRNELKSIADSVISLIESKENDIFCDVACNDGTLLSFVSDKFIKVGIDPANFKEESEKYADLIIQDYFSADAFKHSIFGDQKIKCLTSIAVFYDLIKPEDFISDVYEILDDNGVWVIQCSYSPLMIYQTAFDNICHEHYLYLSLCSLKRLLNKGGFKIMDCSLNEINGGSFRVYAMKYEADENKFGSQAYRDVSKFRIDALMSMEKNLEMNSYENWIYFFNSIKNLKTTVVDFITGEKAKGKTIWGYGSSTKGNTLLQYFGLDSNLISGIAEKSIDKWGLRTVGTNIKIYPESEMRKQKPDFLLVLPWHFISEFLEREDELLKSGTKFIIPCPKFKIISA